jgi:uncharacterized protein (DUF433 family)
MEDTDIDWMACELIGKIPGKVSGQPIVRSTRILPDAIVDSYDLGETIDELRAGFPSLSVAQIQRLIEFAHTQRAAGRSGLGVPGTSAAEQMAMEAAVAKIDGQADYHPRQERGPGKRTEPQHKQEIH